MFGKQYVLVVHGPNSGEEAVLRSRSAFGAIAKGATVDLRSFREHGFNLETAYMGVVNEAIHSFGHGAHGDSVHSVHVYVAPLPGIHDPRGALNKSWRPSG